MSDTYGYSDLGIPIGADQTGEKVTDYGRGDLQNFAMGALAQQDAYRPTDNRGTDLWGYQTAGGLATPQDVEKATNMALAFSGGGLATKVLKPAMGEIIKPQTLFDYSKIHDVPDVKQFDLPRYEPPRGVSERVADLVANKRVRNQMLDYMERGKNELKGDTFYYNEPLRQAFIDELGKRQGQEGFSRYMDYVAGTSPRSKVPENARNASFYYTLEKQGLPLPEVNPQPYGHMAQDLHRLNAEKIRSGEYLDPVKNPKPLSFSQNLQGNFDPATVDAHAFKLPAMLAKDPRFIAGSVKLEKGQPTINPSKMLESGEITMKDALQRPVFWASKPNANEYAAMERYYQSLARELEMAPAQGQGSSWAAGGKVTGLGSVAGDPFMRAVENRANITAQQRGISPAEALSRMMRGKEALLSLGGATAMGGLAAQDQYQEPQ